MNDEYFPIQALSGYGRNIDSKADADKLILILKPTGGIMVTENIICSDCSDNEYGSVLPLFFKKKQENVLNYDSQDFSVSSVERLEDCQDCV